MNKWWNAISSHWTHPEFDNSGRIFAYWRCIRVHCGAITACSHQQGATRAHTADYRASDPEPKHPLKQTKQYRYYQLLLMEFRSGTGRVSCATAAHVERFYFCDKWSKAWLKSTLTREDMNCPGCEGCRIYLGHCHLLSVLVRAACQSNGNAHKNHTLTCGVNSGFGRPLVGPVWLGEGTINLQCGSAATLWEGARWRRVWGPDRGSLTLWHQPQGGWACQWVVGFSFSTCIWSRARVFRGFLVAKP